MSLIRYNPRGLTPWFDFDRFFEDLEPGMGLMRKEGEKAWSPAVDIYEDDKEIVIKADLPEVDEKDIDLRVDDGQMTIKAERKFEHEEKKENYHRVERRYGSFMRSFALPETVDPEKIAAKYDKGVLKVTLPKTAKPKNARTIPVH
jgi:HSP20 family protein